MEANHSSGRRARQIVACGLLLLACLPAWAQWAFLGPQWIAADSVTAHAIALNDQHQVHVAAIEGGRATAYRYDGSQWLSLTAGLPTSTASGCDLAIDENGDPLLVLAPALALWRHDGTQWQPIAGPPAFTDARDPLLRVTHDGKRWLAAWLPGTADSTLLYGDQGTGNWQPAGKLPGRLLDMAFTDDGSPLLLLSGAAALHHYVAGSWHSYPGWSQPSASYVAMTTLQDGSDSGVVVLRRSPTDGLTAERYAPGGWQQLGLADFATADQVDLAMGQTGILHVASVHAATQGLPAVQQFVAGTWQPLGGVAAYNNTVALPRLAFDAGAAYLAFADAEQDLRNSVMYLGTPMGALDAADPVRAEAYPMPAGTQVQVRLDVPVAGVHATLIDVLGRVRMETRLPADGLLPLDGLEAGAYRLRLDLPRKAPIFLSIIRL